MSSTYKKFSILAALVLALSVGGQVSAQTTEVSGEDSAVGSAGTSVTVQKDPAGRPLPPKDPRVKPAVNGMRKENLEQNKDLRNKMLGERKEIANERREDVKTLRNEKREDFKNASSTSEKKLIIERFRDAKGELLKKARKDEVISRQKMIVNELTLKLKYLKDAANRIENILAKMESQGKSVTDARLALDTAGKKIVAAEVAIDAFKNWKPTETGTASTTEVSLTKPREAAQGAITAIKDAAEALRKILPSVEPKREATASTTVQTTN